MSTSSIYDRHDKAFASVQAFVILDNGERVATVAIKFPRDGAMRLHAYVHWLGLEMVNGWAGGGGYDKRTAAVCGAACKLSRQPHPEHWKPDTSTRFHAFVQALLTRGGEDWTRKLEDAGFQVLQAV